MTPGATPASGPAVPLLDIEALSVTYRTDGGTRVAAVRDVTMSVGRGEILAVVGPSGSGKTSLARAITRLLPRDAELAARRMHFDGGDIVACDSDKLQRLRGGSIGWIVQNAMHAWSPHRTIGDHLADIVRAHRHDLDPDAIDARVAGMVGDVGLERRQLTARASALSGGMLQRAAIAAAVIANPKLVIADEPTSALDTIAKSQLLALLSSLRARHGLTLLYITHDLTAMRKLADRVAILHDGEIVEQGPVDVVMSDPQHPETQRLIGAARPCRRQPLAVPTSPPTSAPILELQSVTKTYDSAASGHVVRAVDHVNLTVDAGEIVALVGPSGSGKSTLGRLIMRLETPTGGRIVLRADDAGRVIDIATAQRRALAQVRSQLQMVFQDPFGSLNPRRSVFDTVAEPLRAQRADRRLVHQQVTDMLGSVELDAADVLWRYPFELSGGQRQRVGIARALITRPAIVIADEPTSMVDTVVEAELLRLVVRLREATGATFVIITHDMSVARRCSDRIVVMDAGSIVEDGPADVVLDAPRHATTRALTAAAGLEA